MSGWHTKDLCRGLQESPNLKPFFPTCRGKNVLYPHYHQIYQEMILHWLFAGFYRELRFATLKKVDFMKGKQTRKELTSLKPWDFVGKCNYHVIIGINIYLRM